MTVVVGTAGHIDHGKTTLLRALTGIDADRLPEEQRRGMTIDVGYAHLALPDGTELDFVDVPGHDKLVGNMLVGAGEIDAALLVVAADDGPRAQTLEHLEILDALGISDGIAVVTKADTVDPARADDVAQGVAGLLARTTLTGAAVLIVSATTGAGLDVLRSALVDLRDRVLARGLDDDETRLAVDRAFTVKGRGTVVTGTLRGRPLERGATLRLVPGGGTVRSRELQVHGRSVAVAPPGRAAINVAGSEVVGLGRGSVLAAGRNVVASDRLLVSLRAPAALTGARSRLPPDRARVHVHLGTARVAAVVGRSGRDDVTLPGSEVAAVLRLEATIAVAPGDRFVLRRPSPADTVAGGQVLDPEPSRGVSRRRTTPDRIAALALAAADPGAPAWHAARLDLHGALDGSLVELAPDVARWLDDIIVEAVTDQPGLSQAELRTLGARALRRVVSMGPALPTGAVSVAIDGLVAEGRLERRGDRIHLPGSADDTQPSPALVDAMTRLERALDVSAPPALAEAARLAGCPAEGIRALEAAGRIVRLEDDLAYGAATYRSIERQAIDLAAQAPLTPAALRDATGTSRKYVMAILEDLDRRGILRRTPAGHVLGPRAASEVAR